MSNLTKIWENAIITKKIKINLVTTFVAPMFNFASEPFEHQIGKESMHLRRGFGEEFFQYFRRPEY